MNYLLKHESEMGRVEASRNDNYFQDHVGR